MGTNRGRKPIPRRKQLSVEEYVRGVVNNDRSILAQAITLIERQGSAYQSKAQQVLKQVLSHTGEAIRIGITGIPGAGKSTLIEALGEMLCEQGLKVAVLAVDPSSSLTQGSILGDKTRMEKLSRNKRAFIRPSPSGGTLGGVTRKSRETMLLCEAAGYDVILVETIGVGQSEIAVRSMVDFFLVLAIAGAGDELQGLKKGVIELADAIVVNKADGPNKEQAMKAQAEFNQVLRYLHPATEGWQTKSFTCSAHTGEGIADIWQVIQQFKTETQQSGVFASRRKEQSLQWMEALVEERLKQNFEDNARLQQYRPEIEQKVLQGQWTPTQAAEQLLNVYFDKGKSSDQTETNVNDQDATGTEDHKAGPLPPRKIAHIGIAVTSIEETLPVYEQLLGLELEGIEEVPSEQVRVAFLKVGESRIELLESLTADSAIAKFIATRGPGIHHLAFDVDNIEHRLQHFSDNGLRLIHERPKEGAHGAQVAFLHPKSTGGALLELCQYPLDQTGGEGE